VGTTEPYARATLATRLLGRVQEVRVTEGQRVAAGAVLVRSGEDIAQDVTLLEVRPDGVRTGRFLHA